MAHLALLIQSCLLIIILTNQLKVVKSESEVKRVWLSSEGVECATPCATKGSDSFWCRKVHRGWDHCSISPLLDYKGNKCENKCSHHGQSYNWCWIRGGDWGYCSPGGYDVYVKHYGSHTGKECTSNCIRHTSYFRTSYYWCQVEGTWDYCSPNKGRNAAGTECITNCGQEEKTTYSWCLDPKKNWQYCSSVSKTFEGNCSATTLKISQPMPVSNKTQSSLSKRSLFNMNVDHENKNLCQNLAQRHLGTHPELKHTSLKSEPENPVVEYWYSEEGDNKLPHMIHSHIFQRHRKCPKTKFGDAFVDQNIFMDGRVGDRRGHTVSSDLCGPVEWYNLSPQMNLKYGNRGEGSKFSVEEWFADMLDHNPCVYLDHWITSIYEKGSRRPTYFQVCFAFKDVVTHRIMLGPDAKISQNPIHTIDTKIDKLIQYLVEDSFGTPYERVNGSWRKVFHPSRKAHKHSDFIQSKRLVKYKDY